MKISVKSAIYQAASGLYKTLGFSGREPQGLRVLMYHSVGTSVEGDSNKLYDIAPELFKSHIAFLFHKYKNSMANLQDAVPQVSSYKIALTFDDGYRDNLHVAAPLLVEYGIPFTVFACTGYISSNKPGFLSAQELRELDRLPGASIGSHTINHLRLTQCSNEVLRNELAGSKAYLEDALGHEVSMLSYPHGDVDQRVRDEAEIAGYKIGATSRFDRNLPGRDPLLLCRTDIWAHDDLSSFEQKLRGDWDWRRWLSADPSVRNNVG